MADSGLLPLRRLALFCSSACPVTRLRPHLCLLNRPRPRPCSTRLLKPGGVAAIMEMNPASPAFQRIFNNPFAFAAFKSTEPHLAGARACARVQGAAQASQGVRVCRCLCAGPRAPCRRALRGP
jgi:hypothetical protein